MPDRSNERSLLQYAIVNGDQWSRGTNCWEVLWPWQRIWKSTLLATKLGKIRREHQAAVVVVRGEDVPEHKINPAELLDPKSPYYWDVRFPRRRGRRGLLPPRTPRRYPRELD